MRKLKPLLPEAYTRQTILARLTPTTFGHSRDGEVYVHEHGPISRRVAGWKKSMSHLRCTALADSVGSESFYNLRDWVNFFAILRFKVIVCSS